MKTNAVKIALDVGPVMSPCQVICGTTTFINVPSFYGGKDFDLFLEVIDHIIDPPFRVA